MADDPLLQPYRLTLQMTAQRICVGQIGGCEHSLRVPQHQLLIGIVRQSLLPLGRKSPRPVVQFNIMPPELG